MTYDGAIRFRCVKVRSDGASLRVIGAGLSRPNELEMVCDADDIFAPISGRALDAQASAGVSGRQPLGRALPSLIVGAPDSTAAHFRDASAASPSASLVNMAAPGLVNELISSTVRVPGAFLARRRAAMATFREVPEKLEPYRAGWSARLPADSPARVVNPPLLHLLAMRFRVRR